MTDTERLDWLFSHLQNFNYKYHFEWIDKGFIIRTYGDNKRQAIDNAMEEEKETEKEGERG